MNTSIEDCRRRFKAAVKALDASLNAISDTARRLSDNEYLLAADERIASRNRGIIELYAYSRRGETSEIASVYEQLSQLRAMKAPVSPELQALDELCADCLAVLKEANNLREQILPRYLNKLSEYSDYAGVLPHSITAGIVASLEIVIKNIRKCY